MLVLSRKLDERVLITLRDGRTVELVVVRIENGKVRLGISAPRDVVIKRAELDQARGE